jgi:hypothetical protein
MKYTMIAILRRKMLEDADWWLRGHNYGSSVSWRHTPVRGGGSTITG